MQSRFNWNRIYIDFSPKLLGICRRYIDNPDTAEDILQDSFIIAMQKEAQLKNIESIFPWLKRIVINNALLHLRNNHQHFFDNTEINNIADTSSNMTTQSFEENHLVLGYNFSTEELLSSIDHLSPHHKSVFNLYYIENYSHSQISDFLGININTSKSHLLRAKKSIQQFLIKKTTGKNLSDFKKNTIKLMIFLGFGNLLWAQAFQVKFKNFTLSPQSASQFDTVLSTKNEILLRKNNGLKNAFLTKVFTVIALFSGIIFFGLLDFKNQWLSNRDFEETTTPKFIESWDNNTVLEEKKEVPKLISSKKIIISDNSIERNLPISTTSSKKDIIEEKKSEIATAQLLTKDSSKTQAEKKQIIVVKKIVKRETVYVER